MSTTPPPSNPPKADLTTTKALAWDNPESKRQITAAFRVGDAAGVVTAFGGDPVDRVQLDLARYAIGIRRQDVGTLGNGDIFVRRTPAGDLQQVLAPVVLSLDDQTLYQIPDRWEKLVRGVNPPTLYHWKDHKGRPYTMKPVIENPQIANVSFEGYLRMNQVAGCSVKLPPTVLVDGEAKQNPFVGRDDDGEITRIVISVGVAGPAPLTGNIVVVQYILDLDPRTDLLHMLSNIMKPKWKKQPDKKENRTDDDDDAEQAADEAASVANQAFLVSKPEFNEFRADLPPIERRKWHWIRLSQGVGIAHNLTQSAVQTAYDKHIGIMEHLVKKAQTVAVRNAMKRHPALARQHVHLTQGRQTTVAVVGWTTNGPDLSRYVDALDRVARGETAPDIEMIIASENYDADRDTTGDVEIDVQVAPEVEEDGSGPEAPAAPSPTANLLAQLDEAVLTLSPATCQQIGFPPPADATPKELETMLEQARAAATTRT